MPDLEASQFKRHQAAIACDEWLESDEGKWCRAAADFTMAGYGKFLENRLARAFQAGYRAAEKQR